MRTGKAPRLKSIEDGDLAWLAGILEGEGSFLLLRSTHRNGNMDARVSMQSTDEDVLRRIMFITGAGSLHKIKDRPGRKPCWNWAVGAQADAAPLMEQLWPFMCERRRSQIDRALRGRTK